MSKRTVYCSANIFVYYRPPPPPPQKKNHDWKFFIDILPVWKGVFQETTCPKDRTDKSWISLCPLISRTFSIAPNNSFNFEKNYPKVVLLIREWWHHILDMMSVFSGNSPKNVRVEYEFRIYGKVFSWMLRQYFWCTLITQESSKISLAVLN